MSNAPAPFRPARDQIKISPALRAALEPYGNVAVTEALQAEAAALSEALTTLQSDRRALTASEMRAWLEPLCAAVKNPPDDDLLTARAGAAAFACAPDYPAYLFDARSQQLAMRRCEFWPSVREIVEVAEARKQEIEELDLSLWRLLP